MGLDIKFNLAAAMAAGLTTTVERNGSDAEIESAEGDYHDEPTQACSDYIVWLRESITMGTIPAYPFCFTVDIIEENAHVRANKWGTLYAPLTQLLKDANILWDEY